MRRSFVLFCSYFLFSSLAVNLAWSQREYVTTGPQKGTLMLVGGGANRPAFIDRFVQLAGGASAKIVEIPTTLEDVRLTPAGLEKLRTSSAKIFGVREDQVTLLHTRDRKVADS